MKLRRSLCFVLALALLLAAPAFASEPETAPVELRSDHGVYLHGNGDGTFRPDASLNRAEGVTILYNLLADQSMGDGRSDFTDVPESAWFYRAVSVLASRGLLKGQGGAFRPSDPMSRGELVLLLSRITVPDPTATASFDDVPADSIFYDAVALAETRGWVRGYGDGCFHPNDPLTRAQAAAVFNRLLGRSADPAVVRDGSVHCFEDVPEGTWFYGDVMEASVEHTAVSGPDGETWTDYTRSYAVRFHCSGQETVRYVAEGGLPANIPEYGPGGRVARWLDAEGAEADPAVLPVTGRADYYAVYAVGFSSEHRQYVFGLADGSFRPDDAVTRAQVAKMLYTQLASTERGSFPCELPDVPDGAWYAEAVRTLASLGVIPSGVAFRPDDAITRLELAELLSRMVYPGSSCFDFSDLSADDPLCRAASAAVGKGWMETDASGAFRPDAAVTRAEAVTTLNRFLGRRCDSVSAAQADSRYIFTDVPKDHPAYADILEASTFHWYEQGADGETWSRYWRSERAAEPWEHSDDVVRYSAITNSIGCDYLGNYTHEYNLDYSDSVKEAYINEKGYASDTPYLIWISRQNQKAYLFTGEQGSWRYVRTFLVCTGALGTQTTVGTYKTISHASQLQSDHYTAWDVTNLLQVPNNYFAGYAFHSRLHLPWSHETDYWYDATIGQPRSGGCIRMFDEDAKFIHDELPLFMTVVVY